MDDDTDSETDSDTDDGFIPPLVVLPPPNANTDINTYVLGTPEFLEALYEFLQGNQQGNPQIQTNHGDDYSDDEGYEEGGDDEDY